MNTSQPFCRRVLAEIKWTSPQAERLLKEELRRFPQQKEVWLLLVRWYGERKRFEDQLTALERVQTDQPGNHLLFHSEGQAWFNLAQYAKAERALERCTILAPQYVPCMVLQANVYDKQGKKALAHQMMERAKRVHRGD